MKVQIPPTVAFATTDGIDSYASTRENKTAIELCLIGVRGFEAGLRRKLENGKQRPCSCPQSALASQLFRRIGTFELTSLYIDDTLST